MRGQPSHAESYEYYFSSGFYDTRYPRPNAHVLDVVRARLPESGGHVLDFGCGSGRYTLPVLPHVGAIASFDICDSARARLAQNLKTANPRRNPAILGPDRADLDRHVAREGQADLAMALFGVIAHVEGAESRRDLLAWLAGLVKPDTGCVVLSVPNRLRRFRPEQRDRDAVDGIRYVRNHGPKALQFFYKLYDVAELCEEVAAAGLRVEKPYAESLFPESWLATNAAPLAWVDRWVSRRLPARYGYGLLAVTRPGSEVSARCPRASDTRAVCG